MGNIFHLILVLNSFVSISCNAQGGVQVKKVPFRGKHEIVLKYNDGNKKLETSRPGCDVRIFTLLPDEVKIKAIEKLLTFENDTSICASEVSQYHSGYFKSQKPVSRNYTLQVAALYYINFLAFSGPSLFYSPFPVLYDTIEKNEINLSSEDIKQVYTEYKKWFSGIKQNGFRDYTFPLNQSRYQWFGTVKQNSLFKEYPKWTKEDGCKYWEE